MKYTKEQRLDIGHQIYTGEISKEDAMTKYGIGRSSAENYVTAYKRENAIPTRNCRSSSHSKINVVSNADLELYQSMSKEELIQQLILSKANELRAKKGYEVKGDGHKKEFIILNNKNSKSF